MESHPIKTRYVCIERNLNGVLYESADPLPRRRVGVVVMHSDSDYLNAPAGRELAKRGYRVLCANVSNPSATLDRKLVDVGKAIDWLRGCEGIDAVLTFGHSGGATLMSAHQCVAENGVDVFQTPEMLIRCGDIGALPPADGLLLIDSNWGNGMMTLLSVDPAVVEDGNGLLLDPELDVFNPANGFAPGGSTYSDAFIRRFQRAQSERFNRLIGRAVERLRLVEQGKGKFSDDEPFCAAALSQSAYNNRLFAQDTRLMSHTKREHCLLHADGSATTELVRSVRKPMFERSTSHSFHMGAVNTTVREFLSSRAVRTQDGFGYGEDGVWGVDWDSCYCCTPGNIRGVSAPLLVMGMTGGYEFLAAELIHENAKSADKTLAFVEGAGHVFTPAKECEAYPGQFGDTMKTTFDFIDQWLSARF